MNRKRVFAFWILGVLFLSLGAVPAFQGKQVAANTMHTSKVKVKAIDKNLSKDGASSAALEDTNDPLSNGDLELSNEYLTLHVYPTGGFTGKTKDGKWIFFPGDTSDFTIKLGNSEYDIQHGKLSDYKVSGPYISPTNNKEAITTWTLPEGVKVEQHIILEGDHLKFKVVIKNLRNEQKIVSIRYLWDTQLEDNDGSPLEAKGSMYFVEHEFKPVDFNHWSAYSRPEHATLVTYSWWDTVPSRIIFAHWPEAIRTVYDYDWDPNRRFYTPGYTTSPESDSCVLMYWENIEVPANGEKTITVYYGISKNINLNLALKLERQSFFTNEDVTIQAKPTDVNGNTLYPMTTQNTEVYFNNQEAEIKSIIPAEDGWYLIKVEAPSSPGDYTLTVTFTTSEGAASNSTRISVFSTGNIETFIDTSKDVDANTRHWKYPTYYNAPVYRRGIDTPIFGVRLGNDNFEGYQLKVEIYDPYDGRIATLYSEPLASHSTSTLIEWNWDDPLSGTCYLPADIPVGIYHAKYYITNDDSSISLGTKEFYVIFDFKKEDQYFVTVKEEPDYHEGLFGPVKHDIYNLHVWNERIWKKALMWINGARTTLGAVQRISNLARRIDGTMVYHHSQINETLEFGTKVFNLIIHNKTWVFVVGGDEYDNDFDGQIDEEDENWRFNYQPAWIGAMNPISGRAYIRNLTLFDINPLTFSICIPVPGGCYIPWVDGEGHIYPIRELWFKADKIAWYFDVLKMLDEDFDPENKTPTPHQHSLGVCEDYAMLTVAYMRGVGIKSRVVTGKGDGGRHAWVHWWNPAQNGWRHLDTDFLTANSSWKSNKYNPRIPALFELTDHVLVRTSDPDDPHVIDIADQYNNPNIDENTVFHDEASGSGAGARGTSTFTSQLATPTPLETNGESITLLYHLPENETIVIGQEKILNVTVDNPTNENRTVNMTLAVYPLPPLERVNLSPIWNTTEEVTISAHSTRIVSYTVTLPNTTFSGLYYLRVFENTTLMNETNIKVVAPFTYEIQYNENNLILNEPSQFSIVVRNPTDVSMRNVTVILDLYHSFNTSDELIRQVSEIPPGSEHVFSWSLAPTEERSGMLGVSVCTANMGSAGETIYPRVLSPPRFHVSYKINPEVVEEGEPFNLTLTLENYGDLPAENVTLKLEAPNSTIVERNLGEVEGHSNVTLQFRLRAKVSSDFAIVANLSFRQRNQVVYIPVNVMAPNLWVDLLAPNENISGELHQDIITVPIGVQYNFTIFVNNIGDEKLTNVTVIADNKNYFIGNLSPGSTKQITVTYSPHSVGFNVFNVTVSSDQLIRHITRTVLVTSLDINLSTPKTKYDPGEILPLNITVRNNIPEIRLIDLTLKIVLVSNVSNNITWSKIVPILSLSPEETKNISVSINTSTVRNGTYTVSAIVLTANGQTLGYSNSVNITVGKITESTEKPSSKSTSKSGPSIILLSQVWTTWFFNYYDEFNALYANASTMNLSNGTLQVALSLHENATKLILTAWRTNDLEGIRSQLWINLHVVPEIWNVRQAYLLEREAVKLLRKAVEEQG